MDALDSHRRVGTGRLCFLGIGAGRAESRASRREVRHGRHARIPLSAVSNGTSGQAGPGATPGTDRLDAADPVLRSVTAAADAGSSALGPAAATATRALSPVRVSGSRSHSPCGSPGMHAVPEGVRSPPRCRCARGSRCARCRAWVRLPGMRAARPRPGPAEGHPSEDARVVRKGYGSEDHVHFRNACEDEKAGRICRLQDSDRSWCEREPG